MRLRRWLSYGLMVVPFWTSYSVMLLCHFVGVVLHRVHSGGLRHVCHPIIMAKRVVAGDPIWMPIDLTMGIQPTTKRQIAAARACPEVLEVAQCMCGRADCELDNRSMFVPREAVLAAQQAQQRLGEQLRLFRGAVVPPPGETPPEPPPPAA